MRSLSFYCSTTFLIIYTTLLSWENTLCYPKIIKSWSLGRHQKNECEHGCFSASLQSDINAPVAVPDMVFVPTLLVLSEESFHSFRTVSFFSPQFVQYSIFFSQFCLIFQCKAKKNNSSNFSFYADMLPVHIVKSFNRFNSGIKMFGCLAVFVLLQCSEITNPDV